MRASGAAFVLALTAATLSAEESANLTFASVTTDKQVVTTAERVQVTIRIRNDGPSASSRPTMSLSWYSRGTFVDIVPPAAWTCPGTHDPILACTTSSMPAGASVEFRATAVAPPRVYPTQVEMDATLSSYTLDPDRTNNEVRVPMTLTASPAIADLSIAMGTPPVPVHESSAHALEIAVHNAGPDALSNVIVPIALSWISVDQEVPLSASGAGWSCTSGASVACTRPLLSAGQSAPITLHFTAPPSETYFSLTAAAIADPYSDPGEPNERAYTTVWVGAANRWERVLIPLTATNLPGANGSLWKSDVALLLRSESPVEVRPRECNRVHEPQCEDFELPLNSAFDPRDLGLIFPEIIKGAGQFLYARVDHGSTIHGNARIYDASRQNETAGSEVPVVRDSEFSTSTVSLLNIPVRPQFRHTLRIYDAEAHNGARVVIRFYFADGTAPFFELQRTLAAPPDYHRVTTAQLPIQPGYAQVDLGSIIRDLGMPIRVDVEPLDPGLRLWAFVSITNNDTSHVTVVTPQ